ncbi:MAG: 4-hydroxy-3-methylbut-2-enyl diphosphate reductase [Candidatus Omnitrophica bacterium]|nr:4-hydroxy-3-methylbut-2-enyl diphosphate reductase [Candidatus Omnitrophota bacterium]
MKINIAKSSGFCFGVRRAIEICRDIARGEERVYVLGDIVHNSFVVEEMSRKGIRKTKRLLPSHKGSTLIIRAHGAPENIFEKARSKGIKIVDATCPKVKEIYKIGRKLEKKSKLIIIGDPEHDEVKGIEGQLRKKPLIIGSPRKIDPEKLRKIKKASVITQSTQTLDNIENIVKELKKHIPAVELYNTTCSITKIKQEEIRTLPEKNDIVLIVGSRNSANTKNLFQISKKINRRTYWIGCAEEMKPSWFRNASSVGIMAGASTPDHVVGDIVLKLRYISGTEHRPRPSVR